MNMLRHLLFALLIAQGIFCKCIASNDNCPTEQIKGEACAAETIACSDGIRTVQSIKGFENIVRFPTWSDSGKVELEGMQKVIETMRAIDRISLTAPVIPLDGYDAIRAVHGIDSMAQSGSSEALLFSRLPNANGSEGSQTSDWARCNHGESNSEEEDYPLFLLWHRAYVRAFEISGISILRKSGITDWGVPYWDWTAKSDSPIPEKFRPCKQGAATMCGNPSPAIETVANPLIDVYRSCKAQAGAPMWSNFRNVNPFDSVNDDWASFSNELMNTWHTDIHRAIGIDEKRDMGRSDYAVRDPVFWVHHSNIDRLFVVWLNQSEARTTRTNQFNDKKLAKIWEAGKFRFPVKCNDEIVWYQPSYSELQMSNPKTPMGYRYEWSTSPPGPKKYIPKDLVNSLIRQTSVQARAARLDSSQNSRQISFVAIDKKPCASGGEFPIFKHGVSLNLKISEKYISQWKEHLQRSNEGRVLNRQRISLALDNVRINQTVGVYPPYQYRFYFSASVAGRPRSVLLSPKYVGTIGRFGLEGNPSLKKIQGGGPVIDITEPIKEIIQKSQSLCRFERCLSVSSGIEINVAIVPSGHKNEAVAAQCGSTHILTFSNIRIVLTGNQE